MRLLFQKSRLLVVAILFTILVFFSYAVGNTVLLIPSLAGLMLMDDRYSGLSNYKVAAWMTLAYVGGEVMSIYCPLPIFAKCVVAYAFASILSYVVCVKISNSFCLFLAPLLLLPLFLQKNVFGCESVGISAVGLPLLMAASVFVCRCFPIMSDVGSDMENETHKQPTPIVWGAVVLTGMALLFMGNFFQAQFLATPPIVLALLYFATSCKRYVRNKHFDTTSVLYQCVAASVIGVVFDGVVMSALELMHWCNFGVVAASFYAVSAFAAFFLLTAFASWQGQVFPPAFGILFFPFLRDPGAAYVGYVLAALSAGFCAIFLANGPIRRNV